ncbi:DUF3367 domain-containing protein [Haloechinothrix sp. YIM 98757]|uniref:DUF3367 domain-containing protein n=2 Tax=Haloechinothrix aidingensis TaxID=2752311 RepID=A0A838AFQ3_9PSEU|nr:alpha-(1->3)-arabinofuranosyltransferase [Haloechinothrix aidingensis]MBA0128082.1 DUF3367 domain-containing protein [Haloechinothrix aidingensis]
MVALTLVSFLQLPGKTTFDTKLDLVVDPVSFLDRALHLWNPDASGGELQNQAYGYLFPMGPFFAAGDVLGVPPWIVQRLWAALLLCLAFRGALALARALRIGSEPARYAGALGYALAPRMLTEIGPLSAEMMPAAMLPWVVLPLVNVDRIGSPRRAACLSALAVLGMGGINGAMVIMSLVLPGIWLLTRAWTREHVRLVAWWFGAVTLAVLWWFLPLTLLGEYSLPFVDYVESAANTTAPASLFQVLRGTNQWVAYVVEGKAWWPSGFMLVDNPALMLATGLLAAVALLGLVRAGLPERRFLALGVLACVTLLAIGHVGALDSPLSGTVRDLLDGPLAPLRNVHKFEPGLRLALMLAFTHALTGVVPGLARWIPAVWENRLRLATGFVLVGAVATPALLGTLRPGPGWDAVPGYWSSAMDWVGEHSAGGRTMLLPGTGFGEYTWGKTVDEPAQPLASSPWALRSQIPLGSEGNIRLMDAVENALANGRGNPGLADFLARSGHRFLMLRNDIDREATSAPPVTALHASLARSPGIERVAGFGPEISPGEQPGASGIDVGAPAMRAIEVYEVQRPVRSATAVEKSDIAKVSGGPETLLQLLDSGLLSRAEPAVLTGDTENLETSRWLATDGLRHRERNVGRVRNNLSQTMTVDEQPRQDRPSMDILPFEGLRHKTLAVYRGIRGVRASSAAGYADAVHASDPSSQPYAAIDGDPVTAWQSSSLHGPQGEWLEVQLDTPREVSEVTLRMLDDRRVGWPVTHVRITTDAGSVVREIASGSEPQQFSVAEGITGSVRVTVLDVASSRQTGEAGIAELSIPGVTPQRALRVPGDVDPGDGRQPSFSFSRGPLPRYACITEAGTQRCDALLTRFGEDPGGIHRLFRTGAGETFLIGGTALPAVSGSHPVQVDGIEVAASTVLAGDPAAAALSAIDGDGTTTWIADPTDRRPTLRLRWPDSRTLSELRLATDPASGASQPTEVELRTPSTTRTVPLDESGRADIDMETDQLDIEITDVARHGGEQPDGQQPTSGPAGVTSLELPGADEPVEPIEPDTRFTIPCGSGPTVTIDGLDYATSVSGTVADVNQHRPLELGTCSDTEGGVDLPPGAHEVRTGGSDTFVVQDLWLRPSEAPRDGVRSREVSVEEWGVANRRLHVAAGDSAVLTVPENANEGWVATAGGQRLEPVRVDGWQQGWQLPEGEAATVELEFAPDTEYRRGLLAGAVAVAVLIVLTALPVRREPTINAARGGSRWVPIALAALLVVLGGMPAVVALLACLLARTLWTPSPKVIVAAGASTALATAVAGRLLGHGQEWAYGWLAQSALLVTLAAVVAAFIDWFLPTGPDGAADT